MGPIGVQEMIAIFIIALILFGPKKLPELGRTLGKALSEFRRAKNELKATFETHLNELEREARMQNTSTPMTRTAAPTKYSYPYEEYNQYEPADPSAAALSYGTDERGQSQPNTAGSLSAPENPAFPEQPRVESAPVADTVARTNGIRPVEPVSVAPHEDHPLS